MDKPEQKFYSDAEEYWSKIPATIDGMLGGFGHISQIDVQGSKIFLQQLFRSKNPPGRTYAADCGAGIGRITKHLLSNIFDHVDLVEQNSNFLDRAQEYLGPKLISKVGSFIPIGLQNFKPENNKYDIIWVQWVLGHLTDAHFVQFFQACMKGLKPNGMIVVKENITSSGQVDVDEHDSSITRPLHVLKILFEAAGFDCYRQMKQTSFPKELYNVHMFALKPKSTNIVNLENTNLDVKSEIEHYLNNSIGNVTVKDTIKMEETVCQNQEALIHLVNS